MKKVVRTVWVSLLSGLAFLVACASPNGLSRAEKKQLKAERAAIITAIDQNRQACLGNEDATAVLGYRNEEYQLRQRLSVINSRLGDRSQQTKNGEQMGILLTEMDSLRAVIDQQQQYPCLYGPPVSERRRELSEQLDQLLQAIQRREGACVYGSPEVIREYGEETRRMRQQAEELQRQLNELDNGAGRK